MEFEFIELSNGIRCIYKRTKSPVAYCGMTINTGTRDESDNEHGMAHMIEHLLFKGTKRRKAYHINSLLDNVGGELNAYTTKEETVIHAAALKSDFRKATNLIADIIFNSQFRNEDIEMERGVIIDEINSYKDSPSELIYDDFEDMIFAGSSLGHNILGCKKQLSKFTSEGIKSFVRRCYNTDQMVFSFNGDIPFSRFEKVCVENLSQIEENRRQFHRTTPAVCNRKDLVVNKNTYQTHSIIGGRAYSHTLEKRSALALLVNILGGASSNSRLNLVLREKNGLSYNVEAGYTSYSDTGIFSIYFGCDKDNTEKCFSLVNAEVKKLMDTEMSSLALSRAKKQLLGQLAVSADSNENNMLSSGKSFLIFNKVDSIEQIAQKINGISSYDIMEVANEIFSKDNLSTLIYK